MNKSHITIDLPKTITTVETRKARKRVYVNRPNQTVAFLDENERRNRKSNLVRKQKIVSIEKSRKTQKNNQKYKSLLLNNSNSSNSFSVKRKKMVKYSTETPFKKKKIVTYNTDDLCPCICHNSNSVSKYSANKIYSASEKRISKSLKVNKNYNSKKKKVLVKTLLCKPEQIVYSYISKPVQEYTSVEEERISINEYESRKKIEQSWIRENVLCKEDDFCIRNEYDAYLINNCSNESILEEYESRIRYLEKLLAEKETEIRSLNNEVYNSLISKKNNTNIIRYDSFYNDWNEICEPYKIEYLFIKGMDKGPLYHQHNVVDFVIKSSDIISGDQSRTRIHSNEMIDSFIIPSTIVNTKETRNKQQYIRGKNYSNISNNYIKQLTISFDIFKKVTQNEIQCPNRFEILVCNNYSKEKNLEIESLSKLFISKSYEIDKTNNTTIVLAKSKWDVLDTQKSGFTLLSIPIDAKLRNENQDNFIIQGLPLEEIDLDENVFIQSANMSGRSPKYYPSSDKKNEYRKIGGSTDSSRDIVNLIVGLPENEGGVQGHRRINSDLKNFNSNYRTNYETHYNNYLSEDQYNSYYKGGDNSIYNSYYIDEANYHTDQGWNKIKEISLTNCYSRNNSFLPKTRSITRQKYERNQIIKKNKTDSNLIRRKNANSEYKSIRKQMVKKIYQKGSEPVKKSAEIITESTNKDLNKGILERNVYRKFYHLEHGDNRVVVLEEEKKKMKGKIRDEPKK